MYIQIQIITVRHDLSKFLQHYMSTTSYTTVHCRSHDVVMPSNTQNITAVLFLFQMILFCPNRRTVWVHDEQVADLNNTKQRGHTK